MEDAMLDIGRIIDSLAGKLRREDLRPSLRVSVKVSTT